MFALQYFWSFIETRSEGNMVMTLAILFLYISSWIFVFYLYRNNENDYLQIHNDEWNRISDMTLAYKMCYLQCHYMCFTSKRFLSWNQNIMNIMIAN